MSGNWTELTFLNSSGTATGDRGNNWLTLTLLQIVVASPGTHLVKNYESQSRTNEFQFSLKLKMLAFGPLCNQTINLKTDSKTLYYGVTVY